MNRKGRITLSYPQGSNGKKANIRIQEVGSLQGFDISIEPQAFFDMIAGTGRIECDIEYKSGTLEKWGKVRIDKPLLIELSDSSYDRAEAVRIAKEKTPEGWEPVLSFSSQNSFFTDKNGKRFARTIMYKWVEPGEVETDQ